LSDGSEIHLFKLTIPLFRPLYILYTLYLFSVPNISLQCIWLLLTGPSHLFIIYYLNHLLSVPSVVTLA